MQHFPWLTPLLLAVRNLRRRMSRSLMTILGISLGVAVVLAIDVTNQGTLKSLEGVFGRAVGEAELLVVPRSDEETLDGGLTRTVQLTPGVQIAVPSVTFRTILADDNRGSEIRWQGGKVQVGEMLEIRGTDLDQDSKLRVYSLVSGRFPEGSRYEALTTQQYASEKGLVIGRDLNIVTPLGKESLEIVGLLDDEGAGLLNEGAVAFIPLEVSQEIFDLGDQVHEIAVRADPGIGSNPQKLEALRNLIGERLGTAARSTYPASRGDLVPRMLDSYQTGLFFFSIIAIFVGSFLIYNTFSMTVTERTQEIGMLRAIGMSRGQILRLVLVEAGVLALLGSSLGIIFGGYLARGLTYLLSGFITVEQSILVVTNASVLKSLGIGFLITCLAALMPAFQAARTSPLEALRARSRSAQRLPSLVWGSGLLFLLAGWGILYGMELRSDVLLPASTAGFVLLMLGAVLTIPLLLGVLESSTRPLVEFLFQKEGALGSANVRRSVTRTALTVACLMVAMVLVIAIGSLSQIFKEDIGSWVNSALGSDLFIRPAETMNAAFSNQLAGVPGVAVVSPNRQMRVKVIQGGTAAGSDPQDTVLFVAIDPAAFRQIGDMVFVSGQGDPEANWDRLSQGSSLFVSSVVADEYDLKQGDTLTFQTRRGAHPFVVAAITSDFTGQGMVATGTYADLKRWFGESGADRFSVSVDPNYDVDAVSREIQERYGERYSLDVRTTKTVKESVLRVLDRAFMLFDVLSMIGVVIGGIGVLNTLMMNVLERTREIGGLRSLGMTRGQVIRMVLAESLAMGLVGCVYGAFFGYVMSRVFLVASSTMTGYDLQYTFTARPFILAILIAVGVSQLAAFIPARRAARINLIEALKHE